MFQPATPVPTGPPTDPTAMRIVVRPEYLPGHSDPTGFQFVFAYHVLIENIGPEPAVLFWRHWYIHDPVAGDQEVEGEGVVGESPRTRRFAPLPEFLRAAREDRAHGRILPFSPR
jgi:uncharacterized protein affecting Mg2+/Co2+ transport